MTPDRELAEVLVLADALQSRGDPRGEVISVQCSLETARGRTWADLKTRELELLDRHATDWLGPLAKTRAQVWWRRGHVRAVSELSAHEESTLDDFLRLPSATSLSHLGCSTARLDIPGLRSAAFGEFALSDLGDLPHLVVLSAGLAPGTGLAQSSTLRTLVVQGSLRAPLLTARLPALETLQLVGSGEEEALAAFEALNPPVTAPTQPAQALPGLARSRGGQHGGRQPGGGVACLARAG